MPTELPTSVIWANASKLAGFPPEKLATVREMATHTNLPVGNLQRIQQGGNPTLNTIVELAKALRVDLQTLLAVEPGAPVIREPQPAYHQPTDAELVDALAELVRRVPPSARTAFADVVGGWISSGSETSRAAALLALLQLDGKQRHAA